uniref:hypothetical protein n=1 Tax=Thaumasiovibrio occultus TaxID=1891184 RepID=UPI000B3606E4|nr:hypothetical protein [Thaumasiovibrio occultus]
MKRRIFIALLAISTNAAAMTDTEEKEIKIVLIDSLYCQLNGHINNEERWHWIEAAEDVYGHEYVPYYSTFDMFSKGNFNKVDKRIWSAETCERVLNYWVN